MHMKILYPKTRGWDGRRHPFIEFHRKWPRAYICVCTPLSIGATQLSNDLSFDGRVETPD